jgi:crotonobetainyl-CoA:carnitine CoA-transferase CaiB-like acyl-CoA transferase
VFRTADGPLNIAPATNEMWRRLCAVLGVDALADDPRFGTNADRVQRRVELKRMLEEKLAARTREEWTALLLQADIPAGPINDMADVFADPQVNHCELVEAVEHPQLGTLRQVGSPLSLDGAKGRSIRRAPPVLGQHTFEVLREFGYGEQDLRALVAAGAIVQAASERSAA